MFAIIQAGGRQHRVTLGEVVRLDRMQSEQGANFETDQVLLLQTDDGEVRVGTPVISGAKVQGEVVEHMKDRKVIVFKRKRRKGSAGVSHKLWRAGDIIGCMANLDTRTLSFSLNGSTVMGVAF